MIGNFLRLLDNYQFLTLVSRIYEYVNVHAHIEDRLILIQNQAFEWNLSFIRLTLQQFVCNPSVNFSLLFDIFYANLFLIGVFKNVIIDEYC